METSNKIIKMNISGIEIINRIAGIYRLNLPLEIVRLAYDKEADVLTAHFVDKLNVVDSEIVEENDNIILGLNSSDAIERITILNASKFT